jgi:hypothetical protein
MTIAENRIEALKDLSEKRHETVNDMNKRTMGMIEAKNDQLETFESKFATIIDEIKKLNSQANDF